MKRPFDLNEEELVSLLSNESISRKDRGEIRDFAHAIKPWLSEFDSRHGHLVSCEHWSNHDDPPDIMCSFGSGEVGFEMTRLLATEVGRYNSVVARAGGGNCCTTAANLSNTPFNDTEALLDFAFTPGSGGWADVQEENKRWARVAWDKYFEKALRSKESPIHYVIMTNHELFDDALDYIAKSILATVNSLEGALPSLILHSQVNMIQSSSWMIEKGRELRKLRVR